MPERWLISFYSEVWRWVGEERELLATYDTVLLIDEHPVRFAARMTVGYHEFLQRKEESGSRLLRIYWATPVPEGMLNELEIELLSPPY